MVKITVHLAPRDVSREVSFDKAIANTVKREFYRYTTEAQFKFIEGGEVAAEEAFDLTNNPSRQDEREQVYGRGRSVSVGDVIEVEGEKFLCMSCGWEKL